MKPRVIYLVRHGESEGNVNEDIYETVPDYRLKLTEKGRKQARIAGQKIAKEICQRKVIEHISGFPYPISNDECKEVQLYISPWIRARQTSEEIIKELKKSNIHIRKIYEDPRLREQEWGNYAEFRDKIRRERKMFGTFFYRMMHGESGADVYDRCTTMIGTMFRDFEQVLFPPTIILISHGLTIKAFLTRWFHWSFEQFDRYKNPKNCEIFRMELDGSIDKYILKTPMKTRTWQRGNDA